MLYLHTCIYLGIGLTDKKRQAARHTLKSRLVLDDIWGTVLQDPQCGKSVDWLCFPAS
jgi:hypothetical protein